HRGAVAARPQRGPGQEGARRELRRVLRARRGCARQARERAGEHGRVQREVAARPAGAPFGGPRSPLVMFRGPAAAIAAMLRRMTRSNSLWWAAAVGAVLGTACGGAAPKPPD